MGLIFRLLEQIFVGLNPGLGFRLPAFRALADPVELLRQHFLAVALLLLLLGQAFALLGLVLIAIAVPIAFVTPLLPIGLPIAILGVVLLGRNSLWGRRWMEGVLDRHPRVERFAPNWLMKAVFGREKRPHDKK